MCVLSITQASLGIIYYTEFGLNWTRRGQAGEKRKEGKEGTDRQICRSTYAERRTDREVDGQRQRK